MADHEHEPGFFRLDEKDGDPKEQLQSMILEEITETDPEEESFEFFLDEMYQYEQQFGRDQFWLCRMLDYYEVLTDTVHMKEIVEEMEEAPDCDEVLVTMSRARILYTEGNFKEAIAVLDQESVDSRDDEQGLMYLHLKGLCAFGCKDYKTALGCFEDVLLEFDDAQTAFLAALCYLHLGRENRAKEIIAHYGEQLTGDEEMKWVNAIAHTFDEAETLANSIMPEPIKEMAGALSIENFIADLAHLALEDPDSAIDILKEIHSMGGDDAPVLYMLGTACELAERKQEAKKWFRLFLKTSVAAETEIDMLGNVRHHLQALDYLDYAPSTALPHLKRMVQEAENKRMPAYGLLYYSLDHLQTTDFLHWYLNKYSHLPGELDDAYDPMVDQIYLISDFMDGEYESALSVARHLAGHFGVRAMNELDKAGRLFYEFEEEFQPRWAEPEDAPNLTLYLSDQLITLVQDYYKAVLEFDPNAADAVSDRMMKLICEADLPNKPEWGLLLLVIQTYGDDLPLRPNVKNILKGFMKRYGNE